MPGVTVVLEGPDARYAFLSASNPHADAASIARPDDVRVAGAGGAILRGEAPFRFGDVQSSGAP